MQLATALRDVKCVLDTQVFRDLVRAKFLELRAGQTDEMLMRRPGDAMSFCEGVRKAARAPVPDEVILGTLTNLRKRSRLPGLKVRAESGSKPDAGGAPPKADRARARPARTVRLPRRKSQARPALARL